MRIITITDLSLIQSVIAFNLVQNNVFCRDLFIFLI